MKLLIVYPNRNAGRQRFAKKMVPSELIQLACVLEKEHDLVLMNLLEEGLEKVSRQIGDIAPDLLYVQIYTHNRAFAFKLIRELKKRFDFFIAVGGPFSTFLSAEFAERFSEIDFIIRGEPEIILDDLLHRLTRKEVVDEKILHFSPLEKINTIPPLHECEAKVVNIDLNEQFKYLQTYRGSQGSDMFVSYPNFSGSELRFRSIRKVVSDMVNLHKRYGIMYYTIRDDDFLVDRERVLSFCGELSRRKEFIMWQCMGSLNHVDEELLKHMKFSGLERICYTVVSGSPKILQQYAPDISIQKIKEIAVMTRKIGLHFTVRLYTGFQDETHADVKKTASLLKKLLPGKCEVIKVHYTPGTALFNDAVVKKNVTIPQWFKYLDGDIYVNEHAQVESWKKEVIDVVEMIREEAAYGPVQFKKHRRNNLADTWMTDFMEGDFYLDHSDYSKAERMYRRVITTFPENPWGHLRLGKVKFRLGEFDSAEQYFRTVTELVPSYYGGWLKSAQALVAIGSFKEARKSIEMAYKLNRFDPRILNVRDVVRESH